MKQEHFPGIWISTLAIRPTGRSTFFDSILITLNSFNADQSDQLRPGVACIDPNADQPFCCIKRWADQSDRVAVFASCLIGD